MAVEGSLLDIVTFVHAWLRRWSKNPDNSLEFPPVESGVRFARDEYTRLNAKSGESLVILLCAGPNDI